LLGDFAGAVRRDGELGFRCGGLLECLDAFDEGLRLGLTLKPRVDGGERGFERGEVGV